MTQLADLLSHGYFPRELPPPFQTEKLGLAVAANPRGLPSSFNSRKTAAMVAHFNLARPGTLRRRLGIPNPATHVALCRALERNWPLVDAQARKSVLSKSIPTPANPPARALIPECPQDELVALRARLRSTHRFVLRADISRFYGSIYTHSIPWALHGKAYSKSNKAPSLPGNLLDILVRNGQDRQTVGIPIGPDTSLAIAETVLGAVDELLATKMKKGSVRGFRSSDDYELAFTNRTAAESTLALLQEALSEFELELNPTKTSIFEIPAPLKFAWASELSRFELRSSPRVQAHDIVAYFDRAFALVREHPDEHVLSYAVTRLRGVQVDEANWSLFQHLLMQCLAVESGAVIPVLQQIFFYHHNGRKLDRASLRGLLNSQIARHSPLGHSSEVAWALWTMIALKMRVEVRAAAALSEMRDSVVALLGLDARSRGLLPRSFNPTLWQSYMQSSDLYGSQWLLCYEANVKGWLPSVGSSDHVASDPTFGYLKHVGVDFYDYAKTGPMVPTGVAPSRGVAPLFSLPAETDITE